MSEPEPTPDLIWTAENHKGTTIRLYTPYIHDPYYTLLVGEDHDIQGCHYIDPTHILELLRALRNVKNGGRW
jgi:hypothetical protein